MVDMLFWGASAHTPGWVSLWLQWSKHAARFDYQNQMFLTMIVQHW